MKNQRIHKVNSVNAINEYKQKVYDHFKPYFKAGEVPPFKKDGSLAKRADIPAFEPVQMKYKDGFLTVNAWLNKSEYSVMATVKVCYNGGSYEDRTHFCIYEKESVYLMRVSNGIMQEYENEATFDKSFDYDTLAKQASEIEAARIEYEKLVSSFPYSLRGVFDIRDTSW